MRAGGSGRKIERSFDEEYIERVKGYHETDDYSRAMRKPTVWIEPLLGEATLWHGLWRFRVRGLEKVNTEGLLVAAGQNIKRLLSANGWERRTLPSGGLIAVAAPVHTIMVRYRGQIEPPKPG